MVDLTEQAGVQYSIINPGVYFESNLIGFYNIFEACCPFYDNGKTGVYIWYMLHQLPFIEPIKMCSALIENKVDNPECHYMWLRRNSMSFLLMIVLVV